MIESQRAASSLLGRSVIFWMPFGSSPDSCMFIANLAALVSEPALAPAAQQVSVFQASLNTTRRCRLRDS